MTSTARDLYPQVHLITGATSGIGLEAARALARRGATVVVAGRDEEKAQRVVRDLGEDTGNNAHDYLFADLTIQAEIRRLAAQFIERYDRLDILINNASGFFWRRQESVDGIESRPRRPDRRVL
ncbi:MAG: SDR family NAD(P)-dependent oxidoreductase [Anaerolineae bacterium]|nr:SDR family NAD(P)-dependent oxidoreductase [Anaerolineae bacterium]